jgi:hypothetical protein
MLRIIHDAMSRSRCARWTPLVLLWGGIVAIAVCLGVAGSIVGVSDWPVNPAISNLAESDQSFPLFALGFTLLAVCLVAALACRAACLIGTLTSVAQRVANAVWFGLAVLAVPFILMMAYIRDDSAAGGLHFLGAGVGMGLIGLAGILHSLFCLCWFDVDVQIPPKLRKGAYVLQVVGFILALTTFAIWFVSDKSDSTLEWVGFLLIMASYGSFSVFFAFPVQPKDDQAHLLG